MDGPRHRLNPFSNRASLQQGAVGEGAAAELS